MSKKKRLGSGPDVIKAQVREGARLGIPDSKESAIKYQISDIRASRKENILRAIEEGKTSNYYLGKDGQLMTKLLIYLPWEMAERLREEAKNTFPKKSMSEIVREKLVKFK